VVYAASRSGVLVLATTNDSATSPRPLGTLPRPRTAYQASLDIAARLAAADPGNSSLEHERQLLAHELGQLNRAIDSAVTAARPAARVYPINGVSGGFMISWSSSASGRRR
jgi:hypothetical protein